MDPLILNPATLKLLKQLVDNPASALPSALSTLHPDGPWDLLTQRVGSTQVQAGNAEITLKLLQGSTAKEGSLSSKWTWSASVEADAQLSIDLLTEEDLAELKIRPDTGQTMVAYGASLGFGGSIGAASQVPAWGSVGLEAGGTRRTGLRWFVQAKDDGTLLDALVSAQAQWISPHDLQALLRLANRKDWFGLEMTVHGDAHLQIDLDAKAQGTGWTFSIDGKQSSVGLSFGLDASLRAERESDWMLRVTTEPLEPGAAGQPLGLCVRLHDLKQLRKQAALTLSAGADFSAVTANAERVLRAAWPALDNDLLDALAQPGTAIGGKLQALVSDRLDGPLRDLVLVLAGGAESGGLRQGLIDKLTGGLTEVLDSELGDLAAGKANAQRALQAWLARVLGQAAGAVTIDDTLLAVVAEALGSATKGLEDAIGRLKDSIVGKAQVEVDALLKRLGELGAQFEGKLDRLDDNAASVAIRGAIARYAAARQKLLVALTNASRQKLMLTLSSEWKRGTANEVVFEAWFSAAGAMAPEAEQLYHALCGGRLLVLPELVAAAVKAGAVARPKGWMLSTAKTMSTQRATLNFFGIEIGSNTSWLREVSVKADLVTGNLLAARAVAGVETSIANPWKNRSARLGVLLELTGGNGSPASLAASLDGAFSAMKEKNANRKKVQDLLDAYADSAGSPRTDVRLMLDVPAGAAELVFWRQLTLSISVQLGVPQWARFAAMDGDEIDAVSLSVALRLFVRRYVDDSLFSNDPLADLRGYAAEFLQRDKIGDAELLDYLRRFPEQYVTRFQASEAALKLGISAVISMGSSDRGGRIFLALHRLAATTLAPRRLQLLAQQASDRVRTVQMPVDPTALRNALDGILSKMQVVLAPVALVSETWLGIGLAGADDEPVTWPFTSFVTTMATLAGLDVPPSFTPVAQVGDQPPVPLLPMA